MCMAAPHMIWAHSIVSFSLTNLSYPFLVGVKLRAEKTRGDGTFMVPEDIDLPDVFQYYRHCK